VTAAFPNGSMSRVAGETGTHTVIELMCCGRFTDDVARLYYASEAAPPFHVMGPPLPPWHDGTAFSIHTRTQCWDSTDLLHLAGVAGDVWSFELHTDAFDADHLRAVPDLPHVEIFEHHACTLAHAPCRCSRVSRGFAYCAYT
jgi:hypothetical protein